MKQIILIAGLLCVVLAVFLFAYVDFWQPDGGYEGDWKGRFMDLEENEFTVSAYIDEQSNAYGHMEVTLADEIFILPIHFNNDRLWLDASVGTGEFVLIEADGIYELMGDINAETETGVIVGRLELVKLIR